MRHPDGQLLVEVLRAAESVVLLVRGDGGIPGDDKRQEEDTGGQDAAHDGGGGESHAGLLRGQVDGLLVVVGGDGDVALPHRVGRRLVVVQPALGPMLLLGTRSASLVSINTL